MNIINNIKGLNTKSLEDLVQWVGIDTTNVQTIEFKQINRDKHVRNLFGGCCEISSGNYLILVCQPAIEEDNFLETLVHEIKHIEHFQHSKLDADTEEAEAEAEERRLQEVA